MEFKEMFKKLSLLFLTAVVILLYPLLLVIVLFFLIYRFIITKLAERDPRVYRILSGTDACFAGVDPCTKPVAVMAPFYVCTAKVDKYEVMRVFTEKILKPEDNGGKVLYPEMTQKIVTKYGYHFWYENDNFNLENHVKYINEDDPERPLTRLELQNLVSTKLKNYPYDPNHSPWEILIARNFIDPEDPNAKSAILLRFHHCLFDGYSVISFNKKVSVKPWTELGGSPKFPKTTRWQKILYSVKLLFAGPYHFLNYNLFTKDINKWTEALTTGYKGQLNFHDTTVIPLKTLKDIRNHYDVSFTSVTFTVLVEAIRRTMEKQDIHPDKIYTTTTAYMPGRPDRLINYWTSAKIACRLYKGDMEKTVRYIENQFQAARHSLLPMTIWYTFKLVGILPVKLQPGPNVQLPSTLLVTNVPGPAQPIDQFGYDVSEFGFGGSPLAGYATFAVIISYKGYFKFMMAGDESVLPTKQHAVAIVDNIYDVVKEWKSEVEKPQN